MTGVNEIKRISRDKEVKETEVASKQKRIKTQKVELHHPALTKEALRTLPPEYLKEASKMVKARKEAAEQQVPRASTQDSRRSYLDKIDLYTKTLTCLKDLKHSQANHNLHHQIVDRIVQDSNTKDNLDGDAFRELQNNIREIQIIKVEPFFKSIQQIDTNNQSFLDNAITHAKSVYDQWELDYANSEQSSSEDELKAIHKQTNKAYDLYIALKDIRGYLRLNQRNEATYVYHDRLQKWVTDLGDHERTNSKGESTYHVWMHLNVFRLTPAEQCLAEKGYRVVDPTPGRLPRKIFIKPWRTDAEPLTGKVYDFGDSENPADNLKELQTLTHDLLTKELNTQLIKEIKAQLRKPCPDAFQGFEQDYQAVLEAMKNHLEAGTDSTVTLSQALLPEKFRTQYQDGQAFTIIGKWHQVDEKVQQLGIVVQFDMHDTGELIEKGRKKGEKKYEKIVDTKKYIATSEPISVWEGFTGKMYTAETKSDKTILDENNLNNVFKCEKDPSVPVKDANGQETYRLYNAYCPEMQKADHDKIQGECHLVLGYRPQKGNQEHQGSRMIIIADLQEKKIYYTDQQGALSTQLTGNSHTLSKVKQNDPRLPKQYHDRFLSFYEGDAGWHLAKQAQ